MKKGILIFLSLALTAALLTACGSSKQSADTSTSGNALSGSVATNGSTSMEKVIGVLSEQFMIDNSGVKVSYDATGSGTGIESVSNGSCDIGLSSRALTADETGKGLVGTNVALDGIAIIVNSDSKIKNLTLDQIAAIFTGTAKDWKAVGGSAGSIAAIGREAGSGTRDGFESVTDTKGKCKLSQELTSTGAVIEAVKNSPNAIGYASLSDVAGKDGIKAITVNGVECSEKTVLDGTYKIQRPFVLVTKKGTKLSEQAQAFFDFATSKAANDLITKAGAVPVAK
jgi:phosphate transport system substrate-binding protein